MIGIYKISNSLGQVYIGQSRNIPMRFSIHKSKGNNNYNENTKLQKSFNIYGVENHTFEILEICLVSELNLRENHYQVMYDSINNGLNINLTNKDKEYKSSGAKKKYEELETKKLRIDRVVPKELHDSMKEQVNKLINQLQKEALQKCADESLKSK